MQLLSLIILAGIASAAAIERSVTPDGLVLTGQSRNLPSRNYTVEEAHANVLKNYPAEWIVKSVDMHNYFVDNHGSNHTVYLVDDKRFVHMATVKPIQSESSRRQYGNPCFGYINHYATQTSSWYDQWRTASSCLYTGNSDAGGSRAISWSTTTSISTTSSIDWNVIADILSTSLSMTVTQSWSKSDTTTCNVLKNSVVQVWEQTYLGWGNFNSQSCQSCDYGSYCDSAYADGSATAPVSDRYNLGCSTGASKVSC